MARGARNSRVGTARSLFRSPRPFRARREVTRQIGEIAEVLERAWSPKKIKAQPNLSTAPWVTDRARGRGNGRPAASKTGQAQVSSCAVSVHFREPPICDRPRFVPLSPV